MSYEKIEYNIETTPEFDKEYRRLSKKFPQSMDEIDNMISELAEGNLIGDEYDNLGLDSNHKVYKVKIANPQMRQGKSNGFRLIYYLVVDDKEILLLSIYYKKDKANLTQQEIRKILKQYI